MTVNKYRLTFLDYWNTSNVSVRRTTPAVIFRFMAGPIGPQKPGKEEPAAQIAHRVGIAGQTRYRWRDEFAETAKHAMNVLNGPAEYARITSRLTSEVTEDKQVIGDESKAVFNQAQEFMRIKIIAGESPTWALKVRLKMPDRPRGSASTHFSPGGREDHAALDSQGIF